MSKFFDLSGAQKTLSVFLSVVLSLAVFTVVAQASSTISTNISTGGTLSVTGASTFTGLATALNASTTQLSNTDVAYFGGSGTTTITAAGWLGVGSTTPWGQLSVNPSGLGSGKPEFVIGSSTLTRLIVTGGGNVGIGNSAPATKLEVTGTASSSALVVGGGTTVNRILTGTCTLLADTLIASSTLGYADCAVTGVVSTDTVFAQLRNASTNSLANTYFVRSAMASTTAGFITLQIFNSSSAAAIPSATASFGSSTQYIIIR